MSASRKAVVSRYTLEEINMAKYVGRHAGMSIEELQKRALIVFLKDAFATMRKAMVDAAAVNNLETAKQQAVQGNESEPANSDYPGDGADRQDAGVV